MGGWRLLAGVVTPYHAPRPCAQAARQPGGGRAPAGQSLGVIPDGEPTGTRRGFRPVVIPIASAFGGKIVTATCAKKDVVAAFIHTAKSCTFLAFPTRRCSQQCQLRKVGPDQNRRGCHGVPRVSSSFKWHGFICVRIDYGDGSTRRRCHQRSSNAIRSRRWGRFGHTGLQGHPVRCCTCR